MRVRVTPYTAVFFTPDDAPNLSHLVRVRVGVGVGVGVRVRVRVRIRVRVGVS